MTDIDYKWIAKETMNYLTVHYGGMSLSETLLIQNFSDFLQQQLNKSTRIDFDEAPMSIKELEKMGKSK